MRSPPNPDLICGGLQQSRAPALRAAEAERIAREYFGIEGTAHRLPSYADQNFLIRGNQGRFVLKCANEAADPAVIDMQQEALAHLAQRRTDFAQVQRTRTGACTAQVAAATGRRHHVWMVTFIEGRTLGSVRPQLPSLLEGLGAFLGGLDTDLAGFEHPHADRRFAWDLQHAAALRSYLPYLAEGTRQALVARCLDYFEDTVLPLLRFLRKAVIHNDANDYNVLVGGAGYDARVTGLIDFGDMVRTPVVCEVAIAATYVMLDKADPVGAAASVLRGYHRVFPLHESEVACLYDLVVARLCTSVLMSAHRASMEPDNAYLNISEEPAWALLERLAAGSRRLAWYRFREACGLTVCPPAARAVTWLKQRADTFAPVVLPDVRKVVPLVIDASVASPTLGMPAQDIGQAAQTLFTRIRNAGAAVGVGCYDEPRLAYTAAQFLHAHNDFEERRTIHLGIDLFQEAGSPVFAPLDGTVHALQKCTAPLDFGGLVILRHDIPDGVFYTLYGHLSHQSVDALELGAVVCLGQQFAALGAPEENGGWVPHLHFQLLGDLLDEDGEWFGVAPVSQRAVWLGICPDPNLLLGIPASCLSARGWALDEIQKRRHKHIGANLSISYRTPLHIVRGFGQHLYDATGRSYLDAVNNVPHVGHCHPRVVRAAERQQRVLNTNTRYLHEVLVRYAARLAGLLPDPLEVCFFVNSGSEANDLALRLAHAHTNAAGIVVLDGAYHGHLTSLIAISPYKFDGPGGQGVPPHGKVALAPDTYRGPYRGPDAAVRYAESVRDAADELGQPLCAFICESLLGCGGQIEFPPGYLQQVYHHVRQRGGVCIADEVQVGFGRVGTHFWGFETQGVVPDIVVLGKPMGNGHPLAAVVTTRAIADSFNNGMEFFSTFGGNPVSCAIGMAVLDVIEDEGLQEKALNTGRYLFARLKALQRVHPVMGDVRGRGLFLGVELVLDRKLRTPASDVAAYVTNRMRDRGVLISTDGPFHNVLKIKPPLAFNQADADQLTATLDSILHEDYVARPDRALFG